MEVTLKSVAAGQDEKRHTAPETPGHECPDLITRVVGEARARGISAAAETRIAPRSAYGQNFANYAMNFANYAMNFSNYAMNSGVSANDHNVRDAGRTSLPNGAPLPSGIDEILEQISGRARR